MPVVLFDGDADYEQQHREHERSSTCVPGDSVDLECGLLFAAIVGVLGSLLRAMRVARLPIIVALCEM